MKNKRYILDFLSLTEDRKRWFDGLGSAFFRDLNVKKADYVLDFGCRIGNYTIPVADVVGPSGRVYALDKDHNAIDEMLNYAKKLGLDKIIFPIRTAGELELSLPAESIDVTLFYDVLHLLVRDRSRSFKIFLKEVNRVSKPGALFSTYFNHLEEVGYTIERALNEIEQFFTLEGSLTRSLLHWDHLSNGTVYLFRKKVE